MALGQMSDWELEQGAHRCTGQAVELIEQVGGNKTAASFVVVVVVVALLVDIIVIVEQCNNRHDYMKDSFEENSYRDNFLKKKHFMSKL